MIAQPRNFGKTAPRLEMVFKPHLLNKQDLFLVKAKIAFVLKEANCLGVRGWTSQNDPQDGFPVQAGRLQQAHSTGY